MNDTSLVIRILDYTDRQIRWLFSFPAVVVMLGLFAYPLVQLLSRMRRALFDSSVMVCSPLQATSIE